MTRQDVLAYIQAEHADVAAELNIAVTDEPKTFGYVITETLDWLGGGGEETMAGLATYFSYRLFHAKQVTTGKALTANFQADMQAATAWTVEAGFDFSGGDA